MRLALAVVLVLGLGAGDGNDKLLHGNDAARSIPGVIGADVLREGRTWREDCFSQQGGWAGVTPAYPGNAANHQRILSACLRWEGLDAPVLPDVQGVTAPEAAEDAGQSVRRGTVAAEDGPFADVAILGAAVDVRAAFFQGYRAAGGRDEDRIDAMIWCESSWRLDPGGQHLGLGQFDPGTWATVSGITGFTDPYNPYDQGYNVSVWASMVSPGTSAGWPNCFHAIDW